MSVLQHSMKKFCSNIILKLRKKDGVKLFAKSNTLNGYIYVITPHNGKTFEYNKKLGIEASVYMKLIIGHESRNIHFTHLISFIQL